MNDRPDDLEDRYRRESSRDPSRPSESVRRAVLNHAAQLAAERTGRSRPTGIAAGRPAARRTRWRPAIFGTLAAAALAGVLVAPQFLTLRAPPTTARPPAAASAPKTAAAPPSARNSPATPQAPDVSAKTSRADAMDHTPVAAAPSAGATGGAAAARTESAPRDEARTPAAPPTGRRELNTVENFAQPRGRQADAMVQNDPGAALRQAAETGDAHTLQMLLDERVDVDARDSSGRTPLMLATLYGQSGAVDALLARGADPSAADAQGTTPLQAALAGNQPAIAAALRRAGAR